MASDLALLALVKKMDGFTGPQGPAGAQGPSGPQGPQGSQGPAGSNGRDGKDGAAGPPGLQGSQGPEGPQGPAGEAGVDGQDGNGVESAYIAADGSLVFTLTDGSEVDVGPLSGLSMEAQGNTYVLGQAKGSAGGAQTLQSLSNVSTDTPNDGDILAYDAATQTWKPQAPHFPALYGVTTYP